MCAPLKDANVVVGKKEVDWRKEEVTEPHFQAEASGRASERAPYLCMFVLGLEGGTTDA